MIVLTHIVTSKERALAKAVSAAYISLCVIESVIAAGGGDSHGVWGFGNYTTARVKNYTHTHTHTCAFTAAKNPRTTHNKTNKG